MQSAALLACEAARTIARLSSRRHSRHVVGMAGRRHDANDPCAQCAPALSALGGGPNGKNSGMTRTPVVNLNESLFGPGKVISTK